MRCEEFLDYLLGHHRIVARSAGSVVSRAATLERELGRDLDVVLRRSGGLSVARRAIRDRWGEGRTANSYASAAIRYARFLGMPAPESRPPRGGVPREDAFRASLRRQGLGPASVANAVRACRLAQERVGRALDRAVRASPGPVLDRLAVEFGDRPRYLATLVWAVRRYASFTRRSRATAA